MLAGRQAASQAHGGAVGCASLFVLIRRNFIRQHSLPANFPFGQYAHTPAAAAVLVPGRLRRLWTGLAARYMIGALNKTLVLTSARTHSTFSCRRRAGGRCD